MGRSLNINNNHQNYFPRYNDVLSEILNMYSNKHSKDWEFNEFDYLYTQHDLVNMIKELGKDFEDEHIKKHKLFDDDSANEMVNEIIDNEEFNWYTLRDEYDEDDKRYIFDEDDEVNDFICNKLIVVLIDRLGFDRTEKKEDEKIWDMINDANDAAKTIIQLIGPAYNHSDDDITAISAIAMALDNLYAIEDEKDCKQYFKNKIVSWVCRWIIDSEDLLEDYNKQILEDTHTKHIHEMYQEKYKKDYFTEVLALQKHYEQVYEEFRTNCMNKRIALLSYG